MAFPAGNEIIKTGSWTMSVDLRGIVKRFGTARAVDGVDLSIASGEFVALLGPSGSGKTTLLRIIAGLEFADAGQLAIAGEDAAQRHPGDRRIGLVFQHYALFRHMSVFENVAFGLRVMARAERPSKAEIAERVGQLLQLVQLDQFARRYPNQLSGGQRQRVALARALAIRPRLLLLDEPFGALDAKVRKELRRWLRRLHDEMGLTSLFVTHDQQEALELADRVVVMNQGRVEQVGRPQDIYDRPATPFVFDFIGHANRFEGEINAGRLRVGGVVVEGGPTGLPDGRVLVYVRPHHVELTAPGARGALPGRIVQRLPGGAVHRLEATSPLALQPIEIEVAASTHLPDGLAPGAAVGMRLRDIRIFPLGGAVTRPNSDHSADLLRPAFL
jgi:sulfate transport system ATP-binding protein